MCIKECYEECGDCVIRVERKLPNCEHSGRMPCHMDPETYLCRKRCNRILACQHPCPNVCSEECGNCPVLVSMTSSCIEYVDSGGEHSDQMVCVFNK